MNMFIFVINQIFQVLVLIIIVQSILTFFLSPYHPVRQTMDHFVEPLLAPIRRWLPPMGGLDFSPLVLIILLQVLNWLLVSILAR